MPSTIDMADQPLQDRLLHWADMSCEGVQPGLPTPGDQFELGITYMRHFHRVRKPHNEDCLIVTCVANFQRVADFLLEDNMWGLRQVQRKLRRVLRHTGVIFSFDQRFVRFELHIWDLPELTQHRFFASLRVLNQATYFCAVLVDALIHSRPPNGDPGEGSGEE